MPHVCGRGTGMHARATVCAGEGEVRTLTQCWLPAAAQTAPSTQQQVQLLTMTNRSSQRSLTPFASPASRAWGRGAREGRGWAGGGGIAWGRHRRGRLGRGGRRRRGRVQAAGEVDSRASGFERFVAGSLEHKRNRSATRTHPPPHPPCQLRSLAHLTAQMAASPSDTVIHLRPVTAACIAELPQVLACMVPDESIA